MAAALGVCINFCLKNKNLPLILSIVIHILTISICTRPSAFDHFYIVIIIIFCPYPFAENQGNSPSSQRSDKVYLEYHNGISYWASGLRDAGKSVSKVSLTQLARDTETVGTILPAHGHWSVLMGCIASHFESGFPAALEVNELPSMPRLLFIIAISEALHTQPPPTCSPSTYLLIRIAISPPILQLEHHHPPLQSPPFCSPPNWPFACPKDMWRMEQAPNC